MLANALLSVAYCLTTQGYYEESEKLLQFSKTGDTYNYLRLVNSYALNNQKEAEYHSRILLESFTYSDLPRRQRMLIEQVAYELTTWDAKGLDDIVRDMKRSQNLLNNGRSGQHTQVIQQEIVAKLDRLIKAEEDKTKKQNENAASVQIPTESPAPDSIIMGGNKSENRVDEKKLLKIAESWGTLPPAKRKQVIEEITRDLPPKYKPWIEEYHRRLNQLGTKP